MVNYNCRYIDPEGGCCLENRMCDGCKPPTNKLEYSYHYDVFKGVTTVKLLEHGRCLVSCEIYGQLEPVACRAYAHDMARLMIEKGVIQ